MKIRHALLSLIVLAVSGSFGISEAQVSANYQHATLTEIGPSNVAGRTRAIILSERDTMFYAGCVSGGLFKSQGSDLLLSVHTSASAAWNYIPCYIDGKEVTLPVSDLIQMPDGTILIGTGDYNAMHGDNQDVFAPKGRGMFIYNPAVSNPQAAFAKIDVTDPVSHPEFTYINRIAYLEKNGTQYVYVATSEGLYRWKMQSGAAWGTPQEVHTGLIYDLKMEPVTGAAFFSADSSVYMVADVAGEGQASVIKTFDSAEVLCIVLDATFEEDLYLYAMVSRPNGTMNGIYLTKDKENWTRLSTPTIQPNVDNFKGFYNSSIAIDTKNPKHIFMGSATLWEGTGYVENSFYQWNRLSYSEQIVNTGNFMVGSLTGQYIHSGINKIMMIPMFDEAASLGGAGDVTTMLVATNGGIFFCSLISEYATAGSQAINNGYNTMQFNNIAVAPDGSVLGGAENNACVFIQSRTEHDGGDINNSWFDNTTSENHFGTTIFTGSGSDVAISRFQQVLPEVRRGIFVSADNGLFGRSYNDYNDYTNTQTWTTFTNFNGNRVYGGNQKPKMRLWETTNNTKWNDEITFTISLYGSIIRNGEKVYISDSSFQIKAGDKIMVPSKPHFNYPFEYTFDHDFVLKDEMRHTVHNPIANRLFMSYTYSNNEQRIQMSATPTDFSRVFSTDTTLDARQSNMDWAATVFKVGSSVIRDFAVSNDADVLFVAIADTATARNLIVRVRNLSAADVNNMSQIDADLDFAYVDRVTTYDTMKFNGEYIFNRPITSLQVDPREGKDRLIATFGGDTATTACNLVVIENATADTYTKRDINVAVSGAITGQDPIYTSMVEYTQGSLFVGTEKGVFVTSQKVDSETLTWNSYGAFDGVPVTSIVQQTSTLQRVSLMTHTTAVDSTKHVFAKTKYPYAIYFGTYGRGIFRNMTFVTDSTNEILNPSDYNTTGIVNADKGENHVSVYPNPATDHVTLDLEVSNDGEAAVNIYDLTGKLVRREALGRMGAGSYSHTMSTSDLQRGMYLINVVVGKQTATTKLVVR